MKLDILIPTLNEPYYIEALSSLMDNLNHQIEKYSNDVKIHIHDAGRSMSTGQKRNELIANSDADYFVQIDSDDSVAYYYVHELMKGIEMGVDVITFVGYMTTDGRSRKEFTIKLGEKYEERNQRYYRYPNHLCCFRRAAVEQVKFRPIWIQEDYHYATDIKNKQLLKTEYHVERWMYYYNFNSKKRHAQRVR